MTTPAVEESISGRGSYEIYALDSRVGDYVLVSEGDTFNSIYSRVRPQSINNPKDSHGWRNPSSWGSAVQHQPAGGSGSVRVRDYTGSPDHSYFIEHLLTGQCFTGRQFSWPVIPDWLQRAAIQSAYTRLKNMNVNLSVAFAERKETEELFVHACTSIANGVKAFRSRNPKKIWDLIKKSEGTSRWRQVPNDWLRLQYGWNPLMADVKGAAESLDKRRDGGTWIVARGTKKSTQTDYVGREGSLLTSYAYQDFTTSTEFTCKCVLSYSVENAAIRALASLGITNPFELVWERIPFSFVVDWFLPVGNWLSSWDADFGLSFRSGSITRFQRSKGSSKPAVSKDLPEFIEVDNSAGPFKGEYVNMQRTVLSEPPSGGLPIFKNPFTSVHIANALSLLTQAFR